jgi:hypothetical protein
MVFKNTVTVQAKEKNFISPERTAKKIITNNRYKNYKIHQKIPLTFQGVGFFLLCASDYNKKIYCGELLKTNIRRNAGIPPA